MIKIYGSITAASEIIANRRAFVDENAIVGSVKKPLPLSVGNKDGSVLFDHWLLLKNKEDSYVLINSPYESNAESLHQMGFEETAPLYTDEARTFIKPFSTMKDARDFARSLGR